MSAGHHSLSDIMSNSFVQNATGPRSMEKQ
jgi:hypothetical protein